MTTASAFYASLEADLRKEVRYAENISALYDGVFSYFLGRLRTEAGRQEGGQPALFERISGLWKNRERTAWFERPLLLAAALHRAVINHPDSGLARFYGTCGGAYARPQSGELEHALDEFLAAHGDEFLRFLATHRLQTNEISRGICPLLGLLPIWADKRPRVALYEIGCSAGLNLLADRYGWDISSGDQRLALNGNPRLSVEITGDAQQIARLPLHDIPHLGAAIMSRAGCDLDVPDLESAEAREMLEAMVWGDDPTRLSRLRQAVRLKRAAGAELKIVSGNALKRFAEHAQAIARDMKPGDIFCVFNTVVTCYFDDGSYRELRETVRNAFAGPLREQFCVWIEHEPVRAPSPPGAHASLVTVNQLDQDGSLASRVIAGTEMHPKRLVLSGVPDPLEKSQA